MDETELELRDDYAESYLLGSVAFYGHELAGVLSRLPGRDFWNPHRGHIWDACRELSVDGQPTDPGTVARYLATTKRWNSGTEHIIGTDMLTAQSTIFCTRYADTVANLARRRELMRAVNRARKTIMSGEGDVSEILAAVRGEFEEPNRNQEVRHGGALGWDQLITEWRTAHAPDNPSKFIETPWPEYDDKIGGLGNGRVYVFGGRPGSGKALALDTPIATPTGWTTMGEIRVGDQVFGADGQPTTVTNAWDVRYDRPCFEVEFSDGSVIVADAEHQWLTDTKASRASAANQARRAATRGASPFSRDQRSQIITPSVVTTEQIAATLRVNADRRINHSIPTCSPLALPGADLLIPPYTLGVWLGDGTSAAASYTSLDPEIAAHIEAEGLRVVKTETLMRYSIKLAEQPVTARACVTCGSEVTSPWTWVQTCSASCAGKFRRTGGQREHGSCTTCAGPSSGSGQCQQCWSRVGSVTARLRTIGVLGNKHIPDVYLRASEDQRRALLAGLLDTDGTVATGGQAQFSVTSERLARGFYELAVSLGYRAAWTTKRVKGRSESSSTAFTVSFSTMDDVFRLERKRLLHKDRRAAASEARTRQRYITDVRLVSSVPVRCIAVDNADHLFLAGRSMIPTHNSTAALNVAAYAAIDLAQKVLVISKEMPTVDVTGRILARGAEVNLKDINARNVQPSGMANIDRYLGKIGRPSLHVDARPRKLSGVLALARSHHQRHGLDLLVVDYLQLVKTDSVGRNREQEVAQVSSELKALALELDCVVVLPAQLNRGSLQRADPRPTMSDLRDSGQIEQDADVVTLLHRERNPQGDYTGLIQFIIDKNRHGPTGDVTLNWNGGYGLIA
jgi:replicative DNA helicase